jgi:hypothetical protein
MVLLTGPWKAASSSDAVHICRGVVLDSSVRTSLSCDATSFEMSAAARGLTMMASRCSAMEPALAGPHNFPGVVASIGSGRFANVFSNPWDTWVLQGVRY